MNKGREPARFPVTLHIDFEAAPSQKRKFTTIVAAQLAGGRFLREENATFVMVTDERDGSYYTRYPNADWSRQLDAKEAR